MWILIPEGGGCKVGSFGEEHDGGEGGGKGRESKMSCHLYLQISFHADVFTNLPARFCKTYLGACIQSCLSACMLKCVHSPTHDLHKGGKDPV